MGNRRKLQEGFISGLKNQELWPTFTRKFHSLESAFFFCCSFSFVLRMLIPKGPKIEEIQDRPPGLKFSGEIEIFKRGAHQGLFFVGNSGAPGLKFSNEVEVFKRD